MLILVGVVGGAYVPTMLVWGFSPYTLAVGYQPTQPVPYSHALHVGQLGMDCRYCHNTVEKAGFAAIPPTQTCMNCHSHVRTDSPKLEKVRQSYATGEPIRWVQIHNLANYVYFNHSIHIAKGVGCATCHGRIDKMEVVKQAQPLSMGWCLECHRNPEKFLRPVEEVTNMAWTPAVAQGQTLEQAQLALGAKLKEKHNVHDAAYMTSCTTCHR